MRTAVHDDPASVRDPGRPARVSIGASVRAAGVVAALAVAPLAAEAQSRPAAGKAVGLDEVVVTATRVEGSGFDQPVAIDRVNGASIREDNAQVNLSEALNRVPGIVVQNRQNYAQDLQISSRGFGGRSTFGVRGLRLIADGIPATMPDGQGQAASFHLGTADRIEVLRGPFASLYGNAAGGVIQIFTADGPASPTASATATAGSYGTRKLGLQFGGTGGPFNYIGDLSRFETDGYRNHSAARRDHLNAKLKYDAGSRGTVTLIVNSLDQPETQDPLGLTGLQVAQDRRQAGANALLFNTRKSIAQTQLGATYRLAVTGSDVLEARAYGGDRQVTQYLAIPLATQGTATHSGGVVDLDRGYGGAGLRWSHDARVGAGALVATGGIDYDRQAERRMGYINSFGNAGALKRDEDDSVTNVDVYAQAEWQIAGPWSVLGGVRRSHVRFESQDHFIRTGNPNDSGSISYTKTTPAAGVAYKLTPDINFYANAGRGFETPTFAELAYRADGTTGLNFSLRPAVSRHREAGLKHRVGDAMRLNLSVFRVDVTDEIVVNSNSGGRSTFKNAPGTRRDGLEFSWHGRYRHGLQAALAYTLLDATFTQPFSTVIGTPSTPTSVSAGSRLPGVPARTLYAELVWRYAPAGFHTGVELRRSSRIFVNDPNTEAAAGYTIWNLRAGFEQRGRNWKIAEFVRVDNVGDRQYVGSVIVSEANGRYYEPAPGRNYLAGVQASLQF